MVAVQETTSQMFKGSLSNNFQFQLDDMVVQSWTLALHAITSVNLAEPAEILVAICLASGGFFFSFGGGGWWSPLPAGALARPTPAFWNWVM